MMKLPMNVLAAGWLAVLGVLAGCQGGRSREGGVQGRHGCGGPHRRRQQRDPAVTAGHDHPVGQGVGEHLCVVGPLLVHVPEQFRPGLAARDPLHDLRPHVRRGRGCVELIGLRRERRAGVTFTRLSRRVIRNGSAPRPNSRKRKRSKRWTSNCSSE